MTGATNALVLSAGGVLGAFQAGAISAILQHKQHAPNGIFGSSAGALNGAFLTDRAGRQISEGGRPDWAKVGAELVHFWRQRITGPEVLWKARGNLEIGRQICSDNFRGVLITDGTPPRKLFRDIVRDEIKKENLERSRENGIAYHPGTVDLFSGKIEYPDASDPDIIKLIIASTAIPIAMDCVDIDRTGQVVPFVDGGTRDVAPLARAIEKHYSNIICIVCQSQNLTSRNFPPRTLKRLMARLMSIIINETVNNDLETIDRYKQLFKTCLTTESLNEPLQAYENVQCVTIIRPDVELDIDDMNFTRQDISDMINSGVESATTGMENVFRSLQEMKERKLPSSFTICWEPTN